MTGMRSLDPSELAYEADANPQDHNALNSNVFGRYVLSCPFCVCAVGET